MSAQPEPSVESIKDRLRNIWAEILEEDPSAISDEDVFFELGGDSISAQDLITAAGKEHIVLTMEQIFINSSLEEMAGTAQIGDVPDHAVIPEPFTLQNGSFSLDETLDEIAIQCNLDKGRVESVYPCSPMQESLATEIDGSKNAYVRQFVFKVSNAGLLGELRRAWEDTVRASPVLRTRICQLRGTFGYIQAVVDEDARWNTVDAPLSGFLAQDVSIQMSPEEPFSRLTVVSDADEAGNSRLHLVWTIHHALCDGQSVTEILREVARRFRGESIPARPLFESFIRSSAITPDPEQERLFWRQSLSGINPTPYPSTAPDREHRAQSTSKLEHALSFERLPPFGVTKALLLRAAWAILLSHYTGSEDVGFGAINNGRLSAVQGIAEMTGPTINLVPVALRVDPTQTVASFLTGVRQKVAEAASFEHSGISRIRKYLLGEDSTVIDFQSLFIVHSEPFHHAIAPEMQTLGLEYVEDLGKQEEHPYPLVLSLTLSREAVVSLSIEYDEQVLSVPQVRNLIHHFQAVLTQLCHSTTDTPLGSISPFGDHDLARIRQWNSSTPPTEETCIHHLFQKQVLKEPGAIAVCSMEQSFTYSQVDAYSSSLARRLVEIGVPGTFVAVCFEKSIWTVVAILAVFKAGGVYVPIDPAHPRGRIEEVVKTVQIKVALASPASATVLEGLPIRIVTVQNGSLDLSDVGQEQVSKSLPSSLAYLLFTSGSTGKPKGILMSHSAICTSIIHHGREFHAGPHWRTLQFGSHTFDLSICEFFTTLAFGGCVCIPSEDDRLNNLAGAITALNVNTMVVAPTVANLVVPSEVPTVKTLIIGGEPVTLEHITRWAGHVALTTAYGPSETAVWCSANLRVSVDANPKNIGRGIGATMWITNPDNYHQLTAIGCVGEVVISGALLGSGYFNDKKTTDAAFVPAPQWLEDLNPSSPFKMLYRSGDLARYNPDGTFHIVGRRDTQVKLRGLRVELGEIENQVMAHGTVATVLAALPATGPCARQIVCVVCANRSDLRAQGSSDFLISKNSQPLSEKLKRHLSHVLPSYMVPTIWIVLEQMPLLISGKVDRKALQLWIANMSIDIYRELMNESASETAAEVVPGSQADKLRQLWSETLSVPAENIGLQTSFLGLGGDSISAIQVVSRAKKMGLPVTVREIINSKTLGRLAVRVDESLSRDPLKTHQLQDTASTDDVLRSYKQELASRLTRYPSAKVEDAYILSPFQREIMKARTVNPSVFLLSWQMEIFDLQPINLERLAWAWRLVVKKYPILRSIFLRDARGSVQVVLADVEPEVSISVASAAEAEPTFATTKTPVVDECFLPHRAHFIQHGDRYFVHIELDHLVIDGWSLKSIKTALLEAYTTEGVTALSSPPSYKAFVAAHHPDRVEADNRHWALALQQQRPCLIASKRSSKPDGELRQFSPAKAIIYLPDIKVQSVTAFSVQHGITSASIFDAAWAQTLSVYTHSPDVAFEYVVSGRDEDVPGVFDIVGPLINVLPYHLEDVSPHGGPLGLARLAQRMQEQRAEDSLHTASNVREVVENDLKMGKLFNSALNFQKRPTAVEVANVRIDDDVRKSKDPWHFDVLVRVLHITDDATFRPSFEFDAEFFDTEQMKHIADDFWRRLQDVLA
ncbi:Nonribosomal peptide synthetase 1 [Cytospora mali]|uniref:Nonribosomal peptide synthetase 1 n=1 Tax=Cytospora mali TaxID=578113 RepID=A0A194V3R8_CYTMA|nr:Nonribosomal peptide synthetase 1 [Valsa mali var. pyri (nom. inval.)]